MAPTIRKVDKNLSYCSTTCDIHLIYTTVGEQLLYMADTYPNKVAYIFHRNNKLQLTFGDLKRRAVHLAQNFISMGLQKGDRISFLLPNTSELLIAYMASALAGLVLAPFDQDFGNELDYMIQKSDPKAILLYNSKQFRVTIDLLFPNINATPKGEYASEKFPNLKHLIFVKDRTNDDDDVEENNVWLFDELEKELIQKDVTHPFPTVNPDDPFTILFSSGTTGRPKGVVQTQFSFVNAANIYAHTTLKFDTEVKICIAFLMYHQAAFICAICPLFNLTFVSVYPSYKFDTVDIFEAIQEYKCDGLLALPKILRNVINDPIRKNYDLSSLEGISSGGQLMTSDIVDLCRTELKLKFMSILYGATEFNLGFSFGINFEKEREEGVPSYQGEVGYGGPYTEYKVVHPETGDVVPLNTEGILLVRNPTVTLGYWRDDELTVKAVSNKWYNTGDYIVMNNEGLLLYKSRCKEIITARGIGRLDIYPTEIEEYILKHPNVIEAVAFGVSVNAFEHEVCAWVKIRDETVSTSVEELQEFCKSTGLTAFKVPKFMKFVREFPISTLGKYLRREMQDKYKVEIGL